jgi:hypothetical protein
MLESISYIVGIVGAVWGIAAFVYRPNLKELTASVKEIADLLHDTREDYMLRSDCKDKCMEFRASLNRIETKLDSKR